MNRKTGKKLKESIYIAPEVKAAGLEAAKRTNRSWSQFVETAVITEINRRDKTLIPEAVKSILRHRMSASQGEK